MILLIRSFKRHYHRVKGWAKRMYSTGSFRFEMKFTPDSGHAKSETPDDTETIRFVNLMRRFLNPSDALYYNNVWGFLLETFPNEIPPETIDGAEKFIERMKSGLGQIVYNGEILTAEKIYHLIAEGGYFTDVEEIQNRLKEVFSVSIMQPLLWQVFYRYHEDALFFVTNLLGLIHKIEKGDSYKTLIEAMPKVENRCIYCLSTTGIFKDEEHIFPESLGNDELILPTGFVCRKCNNLFSKLDNALVEFPPIAMLRVYYVPYTKKGKFPKAQFGDVTIEKTKPRHIKWTTKDGVNPITKEKELDDGWSTFNFHLQSNKVPDYTAIHRALYKIALGMAALEEGQNYACNSRFDVARAFIMGKTDTPNKVLYCKNCQPNPQVSVISFTALPVGTGFDFNIFGIRFSLNLEEQPVIEMNETLRKAEFTYFPED